MTADSATLTRSGTRTHRRTRTEELFAALAVADDEPERRRLRDSISVLNMGVARSVARRFRGRGESDGDLEQVAYLGLVKAVNGFDPRKHTDFLSYAVPTISGELKRHFRDHCWCVRPPRRIQELQKRIAVTVDALGHELDRPPKVQDIAKRLHVSASEVEEALTTGCFTATPLDLVVGSGDSNATAEQFGAYEPGYVEREAVVLLAPYVRSLPQRQRDLLGMRFFRDWTQDRIAGELGVSQVQVSRLLGRVLAGLRERIEPSACPPNRGASTRTTP